MTAKKRVGKRVERLTAYHEAGHAVAFYLFGRDLEFVSIVADFEKGEFGRTQPVGEPSNPFIRFNAPSVLDARMDFEREIIINLAGYVAEINCRNKRSAHINLLYVGHHLKLNSTEDPTGDGDLDETRMLFACFPLLHIDVLDKDAEHNAYLRWLWYRTVNIITQEHHWNAVEALAATLLKDKRVNGRQARSIISKKIPLRLFHLFHFSGKEAMAISKADQKRGK
jgi:hypothetical protein